MSLTLTLVDEENIRQRLLEIRKQKLRRNFHVKQQGLKERFEKIAETTLFENQTNILAKEDEEKALVQRYIYKLGYKFLRKKNFQLACVIKFVFVFVIFRLSSETLAEVEQKDIYVRLQEIFRDRKAALDQSLANIEQHYEHIVQVSILSLQRYPEFIS